MELGHLLRLPGRLAALISMAAGSPPQRADVIVVGGGVAGLAAARALQNRGKSWALLELEAQVGGNARGHLMQAGGQQVPCPTGAHYLPVPGDGAVLVQDLLVDLGLAQRQNNRFSLTEAGTGHLCHSPQERLFFQGNWQEGLLPLDGVGAETTAQYRRFSEIMARFSASGAFSLPVVAQSGRRALDGTKKPSNWHFVEHPRHLFAITFEVWLSQQKFTDPHLLWYLDYCCRDDYGAGSAVVSAQAGVHYFASRHGFSAPNAQLEASGVGEAGVLAWPQGNGWLTQRMGAQLDQAHAGGLQTGRLVLQVLETQSGVAVDTWVPATQKAERWLAKTAVVCLPLRMAAQVVRSDNTGVMHALQTAAANTPTSAWAVANIALREPLIDRGGAAPSWDNVAYGSSSLGYVDAMHQSTRPGPGPTVLTWYHALGTGSGPMKVLQNESWTHWVTTLLRDLAPAHPDLARKAERIDVMRYGHAMAVPAPGVWESMQTGALAALRKRPVGSKIQFAHSDLAGYSVFEEAYTVGHLAGQRA